MEAAGVGRGRDAKFVVAVDRRRIAGGIADRDDAAALVGMEEAAVCRSRALVPDQGLVDAWAVNVAALDRGAGLVGALGQQIGAVTGGRGDLQVFGLRPPWEEIGSATTLEPSDCTPPT